MADLATNLFDQARSSVAQLRRSFDGRVRRERLLIIGAAIAVVWILADNLWLGAALKEWSAAQARQTTAVVALQRLNEETQRHSAEARNAEQQLQREVAQLRERVGQSDTALRAFGATLVSASEMVPMLDRLLTQAGGLRLRSMQSLGRVEVVASAAAASAPSATPPAPTPAPALKPSAPPNPVATGTLYRHGIELTIEGSYADVLAYVHAVESMPQHLLWGGLQLKVEQYPKVVVTLRLYTLSRDRNWLEI